MDQSEFIKQYLPKNYEYSYFRREVNERISFRVKSIFTKENCIKWLKEFGDEQFVTWQILTTFPRAGRVNLYKSVWRCQHNVYPKAEVKSCSSKHTECQAKITVFLKRYMKNSRSKDPEYQLNKDWPCVIELEPFHNHPLQSAFALIHKPIDNEVKEKLIGLFHKGHSASSARETLKLELFLNNVENYHVTSADEKYLPSLSEIQHLLNNECSKKYGYKPKDNLVLLRNLIDEFNDHSEGKALFGTHNDHKYVVLCTSIMTRVHKYVPQSAEMMFVEAAGGIDKFNSKVYFFMTPSPAGALPLGVIIIDTEETELFSLCLQKLCQCFPENAFFGKLSPDVIMLVDDLKERELLNEVFPNSKILLCQFHVLKSVWKWMLKNISIREERQELYSKFKEIVYEKDKTNSEQLYNNLLETCPFPNFAKYLSNCKWPLRELWMSAYRPTLPITLNNTNNYGEVIFRLLKDIILDRTKSYNMVQLTDFILSKYESYMQRRCIEYVNGRYLKSRLKKCTYIKNTIHGNEVKQNNDETHLVPSENMLDTLNINNQNHKYIEPDYNNTEKDSKDLELLRARIKIGVFNNPETFQPALKSMMDNTKKYVGTDNALLSAMHTFGKHFSAESKHNEKKGVRHKSKIRAQSTSIGKRKHGSLGAKRARTGGRPVGVCNNIPSKKRKLTHLTHCPQKNKFIA